MNPLSIRGLIGWESPEDGPTEHDLSRTQHMSVTCICFDEEQEMVAHKANRDMCLYIESGRVVVLTGEGKVEMGPGQIIVISAGDSRGIEARERAVVLVIQTPPEHY